MSGEGCSMSGGAPEKKVVGEEDHTLELRLCSDVMAVDGAESGDGNGNGEEKRDFFCKYCNKKFGNSQALGGHQNAHKRERGTMKKDKVDEEALAQIESHLYPYSSFAPYNRLYGSYRKPLGVQSHSMISKPLHSWSRNGVGYGYGGGGVGGWPRYSVMAESGQFPIMNRTCQPRMVNPHYGTQSRVNTYWVGSGVGGGGGGSGRKCAFRQPPPSHPSPPQAIHFSIAGFQPPPAPQTRGFSLGGTPAFRPAFEGSASLQIGASRPLDYRVGHTGEYWATQSGGGGDGVSENQRQEVRGEDLEKGKQEARDIDLTLRL